MEGTDPGKKKKKKVVNSLSEFFKYPQNYAVNHTGLHEEIRVVYPSVNTVACPLGSAGSYK